MNRSSLLVALGAALLVLAAPASALAKTCGSVKGVGGGTTVTGVTTLSGSCVTAKTVAKAYARSQGHQTSGYLCRYASVGQTGTRYRVTCTRSSRKIAFTVRFAQVVLLPAQPALPQVN